jgi:hypothetical protein
MSRMMLLSLLLTTVFASLAGAQTLTLKSASIDPPDRGTMFSGTGSEVVNNNCLACHSAGMIVYQPHLPAATWRAEALKMIHVYKAPVDEKDVPAIVEYLVKLQSAK